MADRVITVPQATQIAQATKRQLTELNGRLVQVEDVSVITDYSSKQKLYPTDTDVKEFPNYSDICSIYVPVVSGASCVVEKSAATTRFALGTTANVPIYNEPVIDYIRDDSASKLELTATGDSQYLLIWFWRSADTVTQDAALESITITQSVPTARDDVARADIALLNTSVDRIVSSIYSEKNYIDHANETISGGYSVNRRWFCAKPIPSGTFIKSLVYQANATTGSGHIELWSKSGNTLTKQKSIGISSGSAGLHEVAVNTQAENETYVSVLTTSQFVGYKTGGNLNTLVSTDTTASTTALSYSDLRVLEGYTPCITIKCEISNIPEYKNLIYIGDGGQYSEIQDALLAISDDSASNPYTFVVLPRGTAYKPFTMLRNSFSETYPWSGKAPRNISIVGTDKAHCIIQSNSGDYNEPCAEVLTNGIIKNLTFIMTNSEQTQTAVRGGYCIHIDSRTLDDVGYDCIIEDCDFENASNACLGIGIHANCNLKIRRCHMSTTLSENYSPNAGYENKVNNGAIFAHTSTLADAQNQRLTIEDCVAVCAEGNKTMQISSAGNYSPDTADFMYTLIRNVLWNKSLGAAGYSISSNLPANPMNYGNNTT